MIEQTLPDVAHRLVPPALYQLAGLVCTGYGSVACRTERTELPSITSYGVLYLYKGSGWVETTATVGKIAVEAGALIWLFPGVAHTLIPGLAGWSEQSAIFDGSLAQTFEVLGLLSRVRPLVRLRDTAQIMALFAQLRADCTTAGSRAALLGAALIHRLVAVAQDPVEAATLAPLTHAAPIRRAVALIKAGALQPLDPRVVAAECGVGYSTLRRRFKQETGQSITDYVLQRRLGDAGELLATTSMSVAEVARAVGFADPYYFSRLFHLKEGIAPSAFRKRHAHGPSH